MRKMVELVYERRKTPQKTRNIHELIGIPRKQEQKPQKAPDANQSNTGTNSGPKPSSPRRLSPEECNYEMLLSILRRKDTQGFFAKPVDRDEVEFYYETIEEPMDFGTIGTKIDKGKYKSVELFERDVMLVFENAMLFNDADTVYYRKAHVIQEVAEKLFHVLKSDPNNFREKFFSLKRGESRKRTKANVRLLDPKVKEEETVKRKRPEAGLAKSKALPVLRRYTYYTSQKSSSLMKNEPVWSLPNFNYAKTLVQRHGDYKRSLMSFSNGLGGVAQRAAMKRLQVIQQEDDRVQNVVNQPQQYSIVHTATAPVSTNPSNRFVNIPCMSNVGNQSRLLLQSSSGTAPPTTPADYPMSASSINWRLNPPMGSQEGFANSSFGQFNIWNGDRTMFRYLNGIGDGMQLPSGSNLSRHHFQSGDQVSIIPSLNCSRLDSKIRGCQGRVSNSNFWGCSFHGGSPPNLQNSTVSRTELHWGDQSNLPSSIFSNAITQDFQKRTLSAHRGIENRTSFPTVNSSRTGIHNHDGGSLDPYFSQPVVPGDDQGDSLQLNLSRLINQIENQMSASGPKTEICYGVIDGRIKKPEDCYMLEGLPRRPPREAPNSSSIMPWVMNGDENVDPSVKNKAGNEGMIGWMECTDMDTRSSLGHMMGTIEAGPSGTGALKDIIIPPDISNHPVILREPLTDSSSWPQPLETCQGQVAPTLRPQGQGRSLAEQETEAETRKRKGKSIMDY